MCSMRVVPPNIVIERQFCCVSGPSAESVKPGNGLSSKVLQQAGALLLKRQRQLGALVVHGTRLTAGSLQGLVISLGPRARARTPPALPRRRPRRRRGLGLRPLRSVRPHQRRLHDVEADPFCCRASEGCQCHLTPLQSTTLPEPPVGQPTARSAWSGAHPGESDPGGSDR